MNWRYVRNSHLEQAYSSVPKVKKPTDVKSLNSVKASPATEAKNPLSLVGEMKKFVVWLSTSSRVSWLHVWKQMHSWPSLLISTYRQWKETQREFEKKKVLKDQLLLWKKNKSKAVHLKTRIQWILFHGKLKNWDLTLRRDTPENSQDALGTKLNSGLSKKVNLMSESLRAQFWEETPEETSRQADCTSKVAWNLARNYASSKRKTPTFYSLGRRQRHRRSYVSHGFGSFNAQCWARRIEFRYNAYFEKVQKT